MPRSREALIVNVADKFCAVLEVSYLARIKRIRRWVPGCPRGFCRYPTRPDWKTPGRGMPSVYGQGVPSPDSLRHSWVSMVSEI